MVRPTESAHGRRGARLSLLVIEHVAGFVERLEELGEAAVPVGQGLRRLVDQDHLEDARHDRHEPIDAGSLRAADRNHPQDGRQPVQDRLDLLDGPVRRPRDLRGARSGEQPDVPHEARLFLGEQVPDEGDQLVAQRRPHEQRARQGLGHIEIGWGHAGEVGPFLRLDRPQPRRGRSQQSLIQLDHAPGAGFVTHHDSCSCREPFSIQTRLASAPWPAPMRLGR